MSNSCDKLKKKKNEITVKYSKNAIYAGIKNDIIPIYI